VHRDWLRVEVLGRCSAEPGCSTAAHRNPVGTIVAQSLAISPPPGPAATISGWIPSPTRRRRCALPIAAMAASSSRARSRPVMARPCRRPHRPATGPRGNGPAGRKPAADVSS
jgi:hypothetical protein